MPESYIKRILNARIYDLAVETPLDKANILSQRTGNHVLLKREDLQPVFSFKIRGAYNKLQQMSEEDRAKGVICASAGNHAQGLALGAQHLGIKRSEEHTSELQSRENLVCRLLLEKKKKKK